MPIPQFDAMNETDVREIVVRPLLHRLGYQHGTENNIRTEVPLRYANAFLGRKNPAKDPPLRGKADYICEVISVGRFAVEVKAPNIGLGQDDVEQAHTYSAHPEIAASHFLLTNGREFRIYATGKLDVPLLAWQYEETEQVIVAIFNLLSPHAVRRRAARATPAPGKPLGPGIGPSVRILGGEVRYGEHRTNHPLLAAGVDTYRGRRAGVGQGLVARTQDDRLHARVHIVNAFQELEELNRLAGMSDDFDFYSSDEYVSTDVENPTVFQNIFSANLGRGRRATVVPGLAAIELPAFACTVFTEATGYINEDIFRGVLSFDYQYTFHQWPRTGILMLDTGLAQVRDVQLEGSGEFEVTLQSL